MKRVVMLTLGLFAALAGSHAQAQQEPLRISYVRSPFNLQLMVMKEHGILQKHLTPLGVQAQWPEITSGAKQAQALASGDLDIGGVKVSQKRTKSASVSPSTARSSSSAPT